MKLQKRIKEYQEEFKKIIVHKKSGVISGEIWVQRMDNLSFENGLKYLSFGYVKSLKEWLKLNPIFELSESFYKWYNEKEWADLTEEVKEGIAMDRNTTPEKLCKDRNFDVVPIAVINI